MSEVISFMIKGIVDDAIRFVSQKSDQKLKPLESNEHDYDEEPREINHTSITTNDVF